MLRRWTAGLTCTLLLFQCLSGCGGWRTSETIQEEISAREGLAKVRATLWDSRTLVVNHATIRNGFLKGKREGGMILAGGQGEATYFRNEDVEVSLTEVKTLEIYESSGGKTALLVGGLFVFTVGTILAVSALNESYDSAFFGP